MLWGTSAAKLVGWRLGYGSDDEADADDGHGNDKEDDGDDGDVGCRCDCMYVRMYTAVSHCRCDCTAHCAADFAVDTAQRSLTCCGWTPP